LSSTSLHLDAADTAWMTDAACRGAPSKVFFVERGMSAADARAICAGCPVTTECLDYALTHRIREGIWGGVDEKGRRRLRRARGLATPGRPRIRISSSSAPQAEQT
jgi:WhiB family redox-sensing transcriptional regulator